MKKEFPGYYRPSSKEFKVIWESCDFVFDTNILLNLYRYSESTRETLIKILEGITDRSWITYQVGFEYHTNRAQLIKELEDAYKTIDDILSKHLNKIKTELNENCKSGRHPLINCEGFIDELSKLIENYSDELKDKKLKHPNLLFEDPIKDKLTELFDGKICDQLEPEKKDKILQDGEERYKGKIPPGYKDIEKPIPDRFGDLIIWFEIIKHAKKRRKPVIFVTDDGKEDWWYRQNEKTLGPRPELVSEILQKAEVKFYMYSADQFMKFAEEYLDSDVEDEAIDEAKEIRLQNERTQAILEGQNQINRTYKAMQEFGKYANLSPTYAAMEEAMKIADTSPEFTAIQEAIKSSYTSPEFTAMRQAMESAYSSPAFAAMEETAKFARDSLISAALNDYDARVRNVLSLTSTGTYAESIKELSDIHSIDQNGINNSQDEEFPNEENNLDEEKSDKD